MSNDPCAIGRCTEIEKNLDSLVCSNAVRPGHTKILFFCIKTIIILIIHTTLLVIVRNLYISIYFATLRAKGD